MSRLADNAELLLALLAIPSALSAVVFRPARRLLRRVGQVLDDWTGEPARPGVQSRSGVMERLQTIEGNQHEVRAESADTRAEVRRALTAQEKRTAAVLADLDVNLAGALDQIEVIHRELIPNGGGSLKDQVTRLDQAVNPDHAQSRTEDP